MGAQPIVEPRRPVLLRGDPQLLALGLVLFALGLYANNLGNGLVYDDQEAIVNNPAVRGGHQVGRIFGTASWWPPGSGAVHYRPVPTLTFALNYSLHGLEPLGYHLLNNLLHGAVSALVYLVLLASGVAVVPALLAAGLFLAHPVHVEVVSWGVGRADLFAAGGILLGLLLHIHATRAAGWRRAGLVAGGLFGGLLAGLSKESGYLAPFVVLAWDVIMRDRLSPGAVWARLRTSDAWEYGCYGLLLVAFWLVRSTLTSGATETIVTEMASPLVGAGPLDRLLTGSYVVARYLGLLLWPMTLSVDYSPDEITRVRTLGDARALLGLGAWALIGALLVGTARRSPVVCFTLVMALVVFAPSSNMLFAVGTIMAERLMYLPVLPLCLGIALGAWRLGRWVGQGWLPVALVGAVVVAYSVRSAVRNVDWRDELSLFQAAYAVVPRSAMANKNLASALLEVGRHEEARGLARQAVAILPRFPDAHLTLGNAAFMLGDHEEALEAYRATLALVPNYATAYLNLGAAYHLTGRYMEGLEAFDAALRLNDQLDLAWFNRVHALVALGRVEEAEATLAEAVRRFPSHRAEPEARQKVQSARWRGAGD